MLPWDLLKLPVGWIEIGLQMMAAEHHAEKHGKGKGQRHL